MIYHNLAEMYSTKELVLKKLQLRVKDLSHEQSNRLPSNDGWSIAEIVEHVSIVDAQLLQLITRLMQKAESEAGDTSPVPSFPIDVESLVERSRREEYIARDNAQPTGKSSIADSLQKLESIQTELVNLQPRLEKINLSSVIFPHWVFGPLTLGQWLVFMGVHEERHLSQIESILLLPDR